MAKNSRADLDEMLGQYDESGAQKRNERTGPQLNIGPNMNRQNAKSDKRRSLFGHKVGDKAVADELTDKHTTGANKQKAYAAENELTMAANYKKGGKVSSASSRGDGCAQRGKTKGRIV